MHLVSTINKHFLGNIQDNYDQTQLYLKTTI